MNRKTHVSQNTLGPSSMSLPAEEFCEKVTLGLELSCISAVGGFPACPCEHFESGEHGRPKKALFQALLGVFHPHSKTISRKNPFPQQIRRKAKPTVPKKSAQLHAFYIVKLRVETLLA